MTKHEYKQIIEALLCRIETLEKEVVVERRRADLSKTKCGPRLRIENSDGDRKGWAYRYMENGVIMYDLHWNDGFPDIGCHRINEWAKVIDEPSGKDK